MANCSSDQFEYTSRVGVPWYSLWMAALRSLGYKQSLPTSFPSAEWTVNPGCGFAFLKFCDDAVLYHIIKFSFDVAFEADWHPSWRMNHWWNIVFDCNMELSDATQTLRILCNQIVLLTNQDGFLGLFKSLVLWASMTAGVGMLCLYSTIEL